jgi:hypothetical protein
MPKVNPHGSTIEMHLSLLLPPSVCHHRFPSPVAALDLDGFHFAVQWIVQGVQEPWGWFTLLVATALCSPCHLLIQEESVCKTESFFLPLSTGLVLDRSTWQLTVMCSDVMPGHFWLINWMSRNGLKWMAKCADLVVCFYQVWPLLVTLVMVKWMCNLNFRCSTKFHTSHKLYESD